MYRSKSLARQRVARLPMPTDRGKRPSTFIIQALRTDMESRLATCLMLNSDSGTTVSVISNPHLQKKIVRLAATDKWRCLWIDWLAEMKCQAEFPGENARAVI